MNRARQGVIDTLVSREPASVILMWGGWIMLTSPVHPLQIAGVVFTVALLALAWASRGRLNSMGFEFLHWNRTSARENAPRQPPPPLSELQIAETSLDIGV